MISFPKKSYFQFHEVASLLSLDNLELRELIKSKKISSFFSENGKKILLREDVLSLYASSDVTGPVTSKQNNLSQTDFFTESLSTVEVKKEAGEEDFGSTETRPFNHPELFKYKEAFQEALCLISQIKSDRSEIWNSLQ